MEYRNPKFTATGDIDCEVAHPVFGWIPFTASANDVEAHGRELFRIISAAGNIEPYAPSTLVMALVEAQVRARRDSLLAASDWTDTLSAKLRLGDDAYNLWQEYRQALRDVPQQQGFPSSVLWPVQPE